MSVVSINGDHKDMSQPNSKAIGLLEDMLERAKSGEIVGVGITVLHYDHSSSWWVAGNVGTYGMLGALDMVKNELLGVLTE